MRFLPIIPAIIMLFSFTLPSGAAQQSNSSTSLIPAPLVPAVTQPVAPVVSPPAQPSSPQLKQNAASLALGQPSNNRNAQTQAPAPGQFNTTGALNKASQPNFLQPSSAAGSNMLNQPASLASPQSNASQFSTPATLAPQGETMTSEAMPQPVTPISLDEQQKNSEMLVTKLQNGMTVLIKKDNRFPLVSLRLYVPAGSSYETPKIAGISHVLEHMVFKGTKSYPQGAIANEVESTGGYLNAATSFDYTVYLTDMTSDSWQKGLSILKEMAFYPTLDESDLTSEKDVIVAELKRGEDNPGQRLFRMTQELLFKGTPYAHPIIGFEETIRSFSSADIRKYIDTFYQPQTMLLLVTGDVSVDEALQKANETFGNITSATALVEKLPATPAFSVQPVSNIETGPWKKVHLALSFPGPAQKEVQAAQLDVLAQLLGGDETSYLYRTYKYKKRLVDSISMSNYGFENVGMIFINVTLDADKLVPFWQEFSKDLASIRNKKFTNEELDRAKLNIEDNLFRSQETLSGLASKLGYFQLFLGGKAGEDNFIEIVNSMNQQNIANVAAENFDINKAVLVGLLPEEMPLEGYKLPGKAPSVQEWMMQELVKNNKVPAQNATKTTADGATQTNETITLGQGQTLILQPDMTLPYVSATMMYSGGDSLSEAKDQGLGSFTAALLTKGTAKLNAEAVQNFLSDRASSFGASSNRQSFTISFTGPTRFAGDLFSLLQDTVNRPTMQSVEAARVKENQLAAITRTEESPTDFAFRRMFPFLFPGHPYGVLQLGEAERVKDFTQANAKAFWQEQKKRPWVLSVTGNYNKDEVIAAAKKLTQPSEGKEVISEPVWGSERELTLHLAGRNQAHYLFVFPTVPAGDKDEAAFELLSNILSGQSGLLFRDMRDKQGLGYSVTALQWKTQKAGALIFYIGTEPEKLQQAKDGFIKVIDDLKKTPLPESELARGKNQVRGDYYRARQSLGSRSSEAATLYMLDRPLTAGQELVDAVQQVTPDKLLEIAKKYFDTSRAYSVTVLPEAAPDK